MAEQRLIDANALDDKMLKEFLCCALNGAPRKYKFTIGEIRGMLQKAPTVDAVPVVRCKDCKHLMHNLDGSIECGSFQKAKPIDYAYYPNLLSDYCSHGERKDGEHND